MDMSHSTPMPGADRIVSVPIDTHLDDNGTVSTPRPVRSTRGDLPARLRDTEEFDSMSSLQTMRASVAERLDRLCERARRAISNRRSKATLCDYEENIRDSLVAVHEANNVYINSLIHPSLKDSAVTWMNDKQAQVNVVVHSIQNALECASIASRTVSECSVQSRISSSQQLEMEAEAADLVVEHTKRRALMEREMAEAEAKLEAQKRTREAELKAQEEIELAKLKARSLHTIANDLPADPKPTILWSISEYMKTDEGSEEDHVTRSHADESRVQNRRVAVDPVDSSKYAQEHQPVYAKFIDPHEKQAASIDSWIDELIPGVETTQQYSRTSSDRLTEAIIKIESERDLPAVELPMFSGAALEWPRFIEQFHVQVHSRPGISDTRKMNLLQSHLKGDASMMVKGLGYSGHNYAQALQALRHAFGHRVRVAAAYLKNITSGPAIPSNDPISLRKFYIDVRDNVMTLKQLQYTSDLYSFDTLMRTARRLPANKVNMWNAHVRDILQQREPSLIDLLNWLERLVDAEYNPYAVSIGSKASIRQDGQHSTSRLSNRGKKMTFKTSSGIGNPQATVSKGDKKSVKKCPKCSKDHTLYRCTEFKDMTVEARRQFVQNHRLCFNCLHSGHIATKCQSSGRCQEKDCHKNHHTLLHIMSVPMDVNASDKDSTEVKVVGVNATGRRSGDEGVFLQIIPVVAYGMNGHAVQTFALLDSASEVSLVENNLAIDLGLKGKKKTLKMKTLNSETVHDSRVVSFTVKGINDSDSEKIHINNAWTVSAGTFGGVSQTVQADMKHIEGLNIESVVPGQVQILIGISTPEAHLQEDIRRGSKEQPIAVRTPLGWSLIGGKLYDQVEAKVNFTFACNDLLGRQVEQFWKTESLGIVYTDKTSLSIEHRRAMSILDSTTVLQNGHYEIGLLWRNSDTVLPDNVHTAQRRYDSVAKRLCNKSDFATTYVKTVNDYIAKGYAQKLNGEDNPADHCTRGLKARELTPDHIWFTGPKFLCLEEDQWPKQGSEIPLLPPENDPELKSSKFIVTTFDREDGPFDKLTIGKEIHISKHSTWRKLTRHTAWVMRSLRSFMSALPRSTMQAFKTRYLQPEEYQEATECLLQQAQQDAFADEIKQLKDGKHINVKSSLLPLMPFFDGRHLRVGGRIHKAQVPLEAKHQLILPEKHHVTKLSVEEFHISNGHCGREHLISLLRQKYWPINARKVSSQVISSCLYCRRQRVRPTAPVMAALPECRVSAVAGPFHVTGVDYFGPMMVKVQRSTVKRWGCLFTCMSTRAIHLELEDSLDTDDFIMVLRNFIGRRGQPAEMYSDNGTNFVGAYHELKQCLAELNQDAVQRYLAPQGIKWNFNPPSAPHFGGAWERLVRSVKLALKTIIKGVSVKESVLRTALIEVEAMLNSRPLTHNSADVTDFDALTPNHFLLGRANAAFSPVKVEDREINSRKRWKQVQVIANHVHKRWLKEYLPSLTVRHMWLTTGQMVQEGDLVLLINDNASRGQWELGRVIDTYPGEDLCVRAVKIKTAKGEYVRPVSKVCILEENVKDNV